MNAVASHKAVRGSANAHNAINAAIVIVAPAMRPKYSATPAAVAAATAYTGRSRAIPTGGLTCPLAEKDGREMPKPAALPAASNPEIACITLSPSLLEILSSFNSLRACRRCERRVAPPILKSQLFSQALAANAKQIHAGFPAFIFEQCANEVRQWHFWQRFNPRA